MMAFTTHTGTAAPLMLDNVDTDQIIPSREMRAVSRKGLEDGLFAGWRYLDVEQRTPDPDFILNRDGYRAASVLVAGQNFGCGSSREHAVWALASFGVRAIIAKSFGDIFHGNCVRNGILPITLDAADVDALGAVAAHRPEAFDIDLEAQTVRAAGARYGFEIGAYAKRLLTEGLDPIGLTLQDKAAIDAFLEQDVATRPWVY